MLRKIKRHGNDDHAEEEEEEGIYAHCQGCSCLSHALKAAEFPDALEERGRTEDEFLGGRQHVERECDLETLVTGPSLVCEGVKPHIGISSSEAIERWKRTWTF